MESNTASRFDPSPKNDEFKPPSRYVNLTYFYVNTFLLINLISGKINLKNISIITGIFVKTSGNRASVHGCLRYQYIFFRWFQNSMLAKQRPVCDNS